MKVLLKKLLIENPIVVYEDEQILEVLDNKMGDFNHLPVVNRQGKYLGIISKLDIYPHVRNGDTDKKAGEVFVPFVPMCLVNRGVSLLEDMLSILKESKYLFIPVVSENDQLAGILPNKVVLELFGKSIGMDEEGEVIEVTAPDEAGTLNKMLRIFEENKVNVITVNVLNLDVFNLRKVYIKFQGNIDVKHKMLDNLERYGFKPFK